MIPRFAATDSSSDSDPVLGRCPRDLNFSRPPPVRIGSQNSSSRLPHPSIHPPSLSKIGQVQHNTNPSPRCFPHFPFLTYATPQGKMVSSNPESRTWRHLPPTRFGHPFPFSKTHERRATKRLSHMPRTSKKLIMHAPKIRLLYSPMPRL